MDYSEYINKYKNIDKDILIYACINALENNKDINIEENINKALKQKQEYEDSKKVMEKLTEEYNQIKHPSIKIKTCNVNNLNIEGEICYDSSTNKLFIMHNGTPCEITNC